MTISDQIDALQKRAADLKSSLDKSRQETNEQVKARLSHAKADIDARQSAAKEKAEQVADRTQSQWKPMKADAAAKGRPCRTAFDRKRDEHDVKKAERDAKDAEEDAADALDYATWAVAIRLLLADVDGTLVTPDKELTDRAIEAVHKLHDAGILFAITGGRPARGMAMPIKPLGLTTPIAAFNGGLLVNPAMSVVQQRVLPAELVAPVASLTGSFGVMNWIYRGPDWYVPDLDGSRPAGYDR